MTYNDNAFDCSVDIMHFVNYGIDMYKQLEDNYIEILNDYDNANRCFYHRLALVSISDDIDAIVHHNFVDYHLDVPTIINCPSFIWSLRRRIAKRIDSLNSWGYDYIMRDSARLKYQLDTYKDIYSYVVNSCKSHNVYC